MICYRLSVMALTPWEEHLKQVQALAQIEQQFPQFAIWREATGDRIRYIARARDLTINPHTVVTADLHELRATLAEAAPPATGKSS